MLQFIHQIKMSSDEEAREIAAQYGVHLSIGEIRKLRPLLEEVSFHWLFSGVPESFIAKVKEAVGEKKGDELVKQYLQMLE